jgi:hypothetical protein
LEFQITVADIGAFQKAVLSYNNVNSLIVENVADKRANYAGQIKHMQNALAKIAELKSSNNNRARSSSRAEY